MLKNRTNTYRRSWLTALALLAAVPVWAQYPGTPARKQVAADEPKLRSTAVLEWVGEPGKPSASRIIPIAVYDGKQYRDGGIYLAQPEPLAVMGGTEYELQQAGVPQGHFEIFQAGRVEENWFGYGKWSPLPPAPVSKLKRSKVPATVVTEVDPDKPHFANKAADAKASASHESAASANPSEPDPAKPDSTKSDATRPDPAIASPVDPDRPTLHKRSVSTDNTDSTTVDASAQDVSKSDASKPDASKPADVDPDRPTLHRHRENQLATATNPGVEARDPDRPTMRRGRPLVGDPSLQASHLTGNPPEVQQMAAVSDSASTEDHPFKFQWADPADEGKMRTVVEALAAKAIAAASAPAPAHRTPESSKVSSKASSKASPKAGARGRTIAKHPAPEPALPPLSDEKFGAYELAYNGTATLVLTARSGDGDAERDVTVIAQPDFDGVPHVVFQSVTDPRHLDVTPRMRLVDAVDTAGDKQAELLFELRNSSDRQFAIYKVGRGGAEQVFATGPLP